jgi:hypothetical protein
MVTTWHLLPFLALSVGLGPAKIRSGRQRGMRTSRACTRPSRPVRDQRTRQRRGIEPLALSVVARKLRQGVPSRRNPRRVASTRTKDVGRWPRRPEWRSSQHSIAVAISPRIPLSTPLPYQSSTGGKMVSRSSEQGSSTQGNCGNAPLGVMLLGREEKDSNFS